MLGKIRGFTLSQSTKRTLLFTALCVNVFLLLNLLLKFKVGSDSEYVMISLFVVAMAVASYYWAGSYDLEARWGARVLACFVPLAGVAFSLYLRYVDPSVN